MALPAHHSGGIICYGGFAWEDGKHMCSSGRLVMGKRFLSRGGQMCVHEWVIVDHACSHIHMYLRPLYDTLGWLDLCSISRNKLIRCLDLKFYKPQVEASLSYCEDFLHEMSHKDDKIDSLVKMGFLKTRLHWLLLDATAGDGYYGNLSDYEDNSYDGINKGRFMDGNKKERKRYGGQAQGSRGPLDGSADEPMPLPNPMVGFSLPDQWPRPVNRDLPSQAMGPPYFYYENVALAPKDVWTIISRFLYDIQPEFVDSKYFIFSHQKRGYIHNLPLENRSPLLPKPPRTISATFPRTKRWWPSWDPRQQFNCLQTCVSSAKLLEKIRVTLTNDSDPPPPRVRSWCWRSVGNGISLGLA
ncbi:unnamed protein product [Miscanthus lutarioriparius]|uniref:SAM-dependent MTase DRM-type domain-containing protein n=1 Tax=Miscanthus lutarioriparius TaxID=422564 RepID=A0A811NCT5_9POAL|nr:unnamed protein product [Miscanthus lutarioriparius]